MINKFQILNKRIAYSFNDPALLNQAFTHRSAAKKHNERLEFLGDAVLGLVVAELLYEKFPNLPEGKLTRLRSNLVKGDTLASLARELDMGKLISLGPGELKSGGHRRDSILADTFEALLGAIYLDADIEEVRRVICALYRERVDALDPNLQIKDNKTRLQEALQSKRISLPTYEVIDISGKDHAQTFTVECSIDGLQLTARGQGKSRRIAEQQAAQQILEKIEQ